MDVKTFKSLYTNRILIPGYHWLSNSVGCENIENVLDFRKKLCMMEMDLVGEIFTKRTPYFDTEHVFIQFIENASAGTELYKIARNRIFRTMFINGIAYVR